MGRRGTHIPTILPAGMESQTGVAHIVGQLEASHVCNVLTECVLPIYLPRGEELGGGAELPQVLPPWDPPTLPCPFPKGLGGTALPLCPVALVSLRELVRGPVSVHTTLGVCGDLARGLFGHMLLVCPSPGASPAGRRQ